MRQALALARRGEGHVEPNPMVGCLLVDEQGVLGTGYHEVFGGPHAERMAIADARQCGHAARLPGCTAVVTLEPCCHHGKTPPCTSALLECGVARVIAGCLDPFSQVAGQGLQQLEQAGVEVVAGVCLPEAEELTAPFRKRVSSEYPWVIGKWAMTLDGKIASSSGHSQWISSAASRTHVHLLRGRVDAILVGIGTALADDPLLTARDVPVARTALRVVLDSQARLPLRSRLVTSARQWPCLVFAGAQADPQRVAELRQAGVEVEQTEAEDRAARLLEALRFLAVHKHATNVLVEGGSSVLGALLQAEQIDECQVFVAPKLLGGSQALTPVGGMGFPTVDEAAQFQLMESRMFGPDMFLRCRRQPAF